MPPSLKSGGATGPPGPPCSAAYGLPVEFRIQFKLATLAFKHFDGTLPLYLSSVLHTYQPARSLRSSSEKLLKTPWINLKSAGQRLFRYAASAVWNLLPNSIRDVPTLTDFRRQLKSNLFRQAFPNSLLFLFLCLFSRFHVLRSEFF